MRWEESDPRRFVRVFAWLPVRLQSNTRKWVWLEWVYRWHRRAPYKLTGWATGYCLPEELKDYGRYPSADGRTAERIPGV